MLIGAAILTDHIIGGNDPQSQQEKFVSIHNYVCTGITCQNPTKPNADEPKRPTKPLALATKMVVFLLVSRRHPR